MLPEYSGGRFKPGDNDLLLGKTELDAGEIDLAFGGLVDFISIFNTHNSFDLFFYLITLFITCIFSFFLDSLFEFLDYNLNACREDACAIFLYNIIFVFILHLFNKLRFEVIDMLFVSLNFISWGLVDLDSWLPPFFNKFGIF